MVPGVCVCVLNTGLFGMSLLAMMTGTSGAFATVCSAYYSKLGEKGALSSTVGGLLLGAGMVISGSVSTSTMLIAIEWLLYCMVLFGGYQSVSATFKQ